MKKCFFLILACCASIFPSISQEYPQLRLRIGAAKSVVSAGRSQDNTLHRMCDRFWPIPSGFGLEFSKPLKKPYTRFFTGAFFNFYGVCLDINPEKFSQVPAAGVYYESFGGTSFYAGFQKRIGNRKLTSNRDYISIMGGVGFSYNSSGAAPGQWVGGSVGDGITNDGKFFRGIYYDGRGNPIFAGYYTAIRRNRAHIVTPEIFGGFRWPIHNKKGEIAVELELITNYAFSSKYYLDVSYTLDGLYQFDRLKNRGINVQFNVLIPLKNFGKKKKKRSDN